MPRSPTRRPRRVIRRFAGHQFSQFKSRAGRTGGGPSSRPSPPRCAGCWPIRPRSTASSRTAPRRPAAIAAPIMAEVKRAVGFLAEPVPDRPVDLARPRAPSIGGKAKGRAMDLGQTIRRNGGISGRRLAGLWAGSGPAAAPASPIRAHVPPSRAPLGPDRPGRADRRAGAGGGVPGHGLVLQPYRRRSGLRRRPPAPCAPAKARPSPTPSP